MKSIQEVIELSTKYLEDKGVDNPRLQAEEILSMVLEMPRLDLYLHFDQPLEEDELAACRLNLTRRANREPLGHLRGEIPFFGCTIKVGPDVLIPRQETEILADQICHTLDKEALAGKTLWDLCTGSGCLGIAIKKRFPELKVICSDLSERALAVARKNASKNGVDIELRHGDLLTPFEGEKADFVVCNPPYIPTEHIEGLDPEVKEFEPRIALDGGLSGLDYFQILANNLPNYLHPQAKVWLEIGYNQGNAVSALFAGPQWTSQRLSQDWAGHDRFFSLERV